MGMIAEWGSTPVERAGSYPCDAALPGASSALYRAVDVAAPPATLFAWLCQMKVAPYSYDWIDNGGRPSPRVRDAANEELAIGQRWMRIFRLVSFERDRQLTLVIDGTRAFGGVAVTYQVTPRNDGGSRLFVKLALHPRGWSLMRFVLPLGDLIMMRKQLLTLKSLAEAETRA